MVAADSIENIPCRKLDMKGKATKIAADCKVNAKLPRPTATTIFVYRDANGANEMLRRINATLDPLPCCFAGAEIVAFCVWFSDLGKSGRLRELVQDTMTARQSWRIPHALRMVSWEGRAFVKRWV